MRARLISREVDPRHGRKWKKFHLADGTPVLVQYNLGEVPASWYAPVGGTLKRTRITNQGALELLGWILQTGQIQQQVPRVSCEPRPKYKRKPHIHQMTPCHVLDALFSQDPDLD